MVWMPILSTDRGRRRLGGFTLAELLVTIAVIGALAALMMPALQIAREAARRTSCLNNIRNIAQAVIAYDNAQQELPGWRNTVGAFPQKTSWTVPILNQMGNKEAFSWFDTYSVGMDTIADKQLPVYVCPTAAADVIKATKSPLCYAANGGTGCEHSATEPFAEGGRQWVGDGVFNDRVGSDDYLAARSSLAQVADAGGDTTTLMLAERSAGFVFADAGGVTWTETQVAVEPAASNAKRSTHLFMIPPKLANGTFPQKHTVYKVVNPQASHPVTGDVAMNLWRFRYPSSPHPGEGATVAFCDGRTKFLSDKIDSWVYCQLITSRSTGVSPRAEGWVRYDHDNSAGTEPVTYIVSEGDIPTK